MHAARLERCDDPLLTMAALVLGLVAEGETVIEQGARALLEMHPGFIEALQVLGADMEME